MDLRSSGSPSSRSVTPVTGVRKFLYPEGKKSWVNVCVQSAKGLRCTLVTEDENGDLSEKNSYIKGVF